jgi:hypothetical protein
MMTDPQQTSMSWQLTLGALAIVIGLAGSQWAMTQLQFQAVDRQLLHVSENLKYVHSILDQRRLQFLDIEVFKAHEKANDAQIKLLVDRLGVAEQTRPTTGELQATAAALRDRIEKLYAAQASLESWVRARSPKP